MRFRNIYFNVASYMAVCLYVVCPDSLEYVELVLLADIFLPAKFLVSSCEMSRMFSLHIPSTCTMCARVVCHKDVHFFVGTATCAGC